MYKKSQAFSCIDLGVRGQRFLLTWLGLTRISIVTCKWPHSRYGLSSSEDSKVYHLSTGVLTGKVLRSMLTCPSSS